MYAGTKVNWHEILLPDSNKVSNESLPLFLCAFSSDKGTEEITDLVYSDFKKMYGDSADFFKYGQPLMQAHTILAAGGRVLGKRIVASDSKLANLIIVATITEIPVNKVDGQGNPLYIDQDGKETTVETAIRATTSKASIKYSTASKENASSVEDVIAYAATLQTNADYPLFIICDNGRGASIKNIRISPDYAASKNLPYMLYKIHDYENLVEIENQRFSVYPEATALAGTVRKSLVLDEYSTVQFNARMYDAGMEAFLNKISALTGYSIAELYGFDILFCKTLKKEAIDLIEYDSTGININTEYGLDLKNGSNGAFGSNPVGNKTVFNGVWAAEAVKFFNGEYSAEIFDLDQHKIDYCVDAAYPCDLENPAKDVKGAIADLAIYREDFFYFRDLGLNINSVDDIQEIESDRNWKMSKFIGDYESTYDVIDTVSHRQIKVTMLYGMAAQLVRYTMNNLAAPLAGEFNEFVITNAIPGTLNFVPRVGPNFDQKQILDDLRVNFVNYGSNTANLVVQSTYTSQDHEGPLSYSNNVIITQQVVKAIRRYCPKIRFMLMDAGATDFAKYKTLIEDNVVSKYSGYFKSIFLRYTADDEMIASKVFNASLYCYYRDFPQYEIFDVFAVEGSPSSNPV